MGQEEKKCNEEAKCCGKKNSPVFFKHLIGLIFIFSGGWLLIKYWDCLVLILKGFLGLFLLLVGGIILAIAKE